MEVRLECLYCDKEGFEQNFSYELDGAEEMVRDQCKKLVEFLIQDPNWLEITFYERDEWERWCCFGGWPMEEEED